jgi:hypothetical protein
MHLEGGLGRQPHGCPLLHKDALLEAVATECAGGGRRENHVKALALAETSAYTERRLRVRFGQNGSPLPKGKPQLEPGVPPDRRGRAVVAGPDERFGQSVHHRA